MKLCGFHSPNPSHSDFIRKPSLILLILVGISTQLIWRKREKKKFLYYLHTRSTGFNPDQWNKQTKSGISLLQAFNITVSLILRKKIKVSKLI